MNPHFMFNVLNSIQGLFTIGSTEKANAVMSRFSELDACHTGSER
jgi:sensor histidine kinase YesM